MSPSAKGVVCCEIVSLSLYAALGVFAALRLGECDDIPALVPYSFSLAGVGILLHGFVVGVYLDSTQIVYRTWAASLCACILPFMLLSVVTWGCFIFLLNRPCLGFPSTPCDRCDNLLYSASFGMTALNVVGILCSVCCILPAVACHRGSSAPHHPPPDPMTPYM